MTIVRLSDLRCEYRTEPLGMDEPRPRLSWRLEAGEGDRGVTQSAYQVLVASSAELLSSNRGDFWDSGRVASSQNTQVEYAGKKLASRQRCHWKARSWDQAGAPSPWSPGACWEMGLLARKDWQAEWIADPIEGDPSKSLRCPLFRKGFAVSGTVVKARAYASALGLYELWINGRRVGEDLFTPGWTDYNVRVQYQTYDVTGLVQAGANAVGAVLGEGWYSGNMAFAGKRNLYGPFPRLLVQLEITYDDGRVETVATDGAWKSAQGPILESDLYNGETYDQRQELPGWSAAGFDDSAWRPANEAEPPKAKLVASASPRVRRINEIAPLWVRQPSPGAFVFDLGQNMVGWVKLSVPAGVPPGTTIKLRHAEVLNPDGTLYTANLRSAKCTDQLTLTGGAACTWEPHFTFHGFRFVEVSGLHVEPTLETVRGVVLHSDTPPAGTFECSSPMLSQLQKNITWGQKGNFLEVPTDCPQRDERLGWTGDAQVFVRTACYNMDVATFFTKWLIDLEDEQSPKGAFPMVAPDVLAARKGDGGAAWADAGVICPWTIYLCYGDVRVLQRHYKAMQRYIEYQNHVDWSKRHCFGDWLNIEDPTPSELIGYAFWAYTTAIMVEVAGVLGNKADAAKYRAALKRIKGEFAKEFLTPRGRLASISQTGYLLALHFDLVPARLRPVVLERLVRLIHARKDHLSTGFVGTPYLLSTLSAGGEWELAYKLLLNEDYPSWGYPVTQGATTMWEHWNSYHHEKGFQRPSMNSFNHYAYGAVGDWMYRNIGGIDLDPRRPGYRSVVVRPRPGGGLTWSKASLLAPGGLVACEWRLEDKKLTLNVTVPPNSTAIVYVPAAKASAVTERGLPVVAATRPSPRLRRAIETRQTTPPTKAPGVEFVEFVASKESGGKSAVYRVGSGTYAFASRVP